MNILCPISLGELVDKLTILEIKSERIIHDQKLININKEKLALQTLLNEILLSTNSELTNIQRELKRVNEELWAIEDQIREKELNKTFDEEFIQLARKVYLTNDERFRLKNRINTQFSSAFVEEKSYKQYI